MGPDPSYLTFRTMQPPNAHQVGGTFDETLTLNMQKRLDRLALPNRLYGAAHFWYYLVRRQQVGG